MKIIAQNRKAFHDYNILDTYTAGLVLTGDEVKSLRAGQANLVGAFGVLKDHELYLINAHIGAYSFAYNKQQNEQNSLRSRKLLLTRREVAGIAQDIAKKGVTLVPLKLFFSEKGWVKVEIGVCTHKKSYNRKEEIKERDIARETRRELRGRE